MKTYTITEKDVARLKTMTDEAGGALGRDLVHGIENRDSILDIHRNVMSTVKYCLINRWLETVAPSLTQGSMNPEYSGYEDDDAFKGSYESYGFGHEN